MIGTVELAPTAALSFGSATIDAPLHPGASLGATLAVDAGAVLAGGSLALGGDGVLSGALGDLASAIVLAPRNAGDGTMTAQVAGTGTLSGPIAGTGALVLSPDRTAGGLVLDGGANTWSGGTTVSAEGGAPGSVERAAHRGAGERGGGAHRRARDRAGVGVRRHTPA